MTFYMNIMYWEDEKMYERSKHLIDCHIAGFTYYDGLDVINELQLGTQVSLISEPENPYDPNAVSIYYGNTKLGYVPKNKNCFLSGLLYFGHGYSVNARISQRDTEAHPEDQFRIVVKIKDSRT